MYEKKSPNLDQINSPLGNEPPDALRERDGILALQIKECSVDHSVSLLLSSSNSAPARHYN